MDRILIAPSTDPAKTESDLIEYVHQIQDYADFLHCDVMDGKFVERKTISYQTIKLLKQNCLLPLDVHLMVQNPTEVIEEFVKSGANIITIHYETFSTLHDLKNAIKKIKQLGCLAGVSIKPKTSADQILEILADIDLLLIMSVEPGKSGQSFMIETLGKISDFDKIRKENGFCFLIEVDGGINGSNAKEVLESGADVLVSGNYVYSSNDRKVAIQNLRM